MARRRKPSSMQKADIFAPTRRPAVGKRRPGRPPVHDEAWTKVTVVLFNRQIVFLDRLATTSAPRAALPSAVRNLSAPSSTPSRTLISI